MKRSQTIINSILALGLAGAMQIAKGSELPQEVRQFAAEQHEQILLQGAIARHAISNEVRREIAASMVAFVEAQERDIVEQGRTALVSIRQDLNLVGFDAMAADMPRHLETGTWPQVAANVPNPKR